MLVETPRFRYTVLILNCLLTFGSYYCFDMPSNLKDQLKDQIISKFTDSPDTYYQYFYLVYSWTNMIMSLCAGLMVDKLGKEKSMYLFVFFCLVGSAVFSLGAGLTSLDPKLRYGILFFGRFVFGLGGGPITIVQNVFTATHFTGHELAMAFGCTLTVSRVGSVINFSLTPALYKAINKAMGGTELYPNEYALSLTLAVGSTLVLVSVCSAIFLSRLDNRAMANKEGPYKEKAGAQVDLFAKPISKKINLSDAKEFPALFWLLAITIALFYSVIFPFMANAPTFLEQEKFGLCDSYDKDGKGTDCNTGWRVSCVYGVSMCVSVALGAFVDWYGRRVQIALIGTGATIPTFYLLAKTSVDPVYSMILLGISYSVCASALWPSVQLLVDLKISGTANGVATSVQMLGIGIVNIIVGYLGDKSTYESEQFFFLGLGGASFIVVLMMLWFDTDGKMYKGKRDARKKDDGDGDGDMLEGLLDGSIQGKDLP